MTKRDWRKDRLLRGINHNSSQAKESLNDLAEGAGKAVWSQAAGKYMTPAKPRRISPHSQLGKDIAKRYGIQD